MKLSLLCTLAFAFLSAISTLTEAADEVKDWNGQPLKLNVAYNMWGVGHEKGPIAIGKLVNSQGSAHYVISKPNNDEYPATPDPIVFLQPSLFQKTVRVGQSYYIRFHKGDPTDLWKVSYGKSGDLNFITTGGRRSLLPGCLDNQNLFKLEVADATQNLYKLRGNVDRCPLPLAKSADITSQWKNGEDVLYLNEGNVVDSPPLYFRFGEYKPTIRQVVE